MHPMGLENDDNFLYGTNFSFDQNSNAAQIYSRKHNFHLCISNYTLFKELIGFFFIHL